MICCYQNKKAILICFFLAVVIIILILTIFLKAFFFSQKNTIRNISTKNILFKQALREILLFFHDIAGLDMNLEEWKHLCRRLGKMIRFFSTRQIC